MNIFKPKLKPPFTTFQFDIAHCVKCGSVNVTLLINGPYQGQYTCDDCGEIAHSREYEREAAK